MNKVWSSCEFTNWHPRLEIRSFTISRSFQGSSNQMRKFSDEARRGTGLSHQTTNSNRNKWEHYHYPTQLFKALHLVHQEPILLIFLPQQLILVSQLVMKALVYSR